MTTLENLFLEQLAEMYEAEQRLARALSRMTRLTTNTQLREALKLHAYETIGHISKVARIFDCFGEPVNGMKNNAILVLLAEADASLAEHQGSRARDAAIIAAVQKLEHYEIATYDCLRDWAALLNNHPAAILLEEILQEEESGDHRLTEVAQAGKVDSLVEVEWREETASEDEEVLSQNGHGHGRHHPGFGRGHL